VTLITKLGRDPFAELGLATWKTDGIVTDFVVQTEAEPTGAAFIFVSTATGDNAIIVSSGAAGSISAADVEASASAIAQSAVFMTQFEQPIDAARRALEIARKAGVVTVLNPAPAATVDDGIYALCDYVTPNESEAAGITGLPVDNLDQARAAGDDLLRRGAGVALITLGDKGALYHSGTESVHIPAFPVEQVVETTGAGDAFNGGFAAALAEGQKPLDAARFACATAALSVGKAGTAPSMPMRSEIDRLMRAYP
jgi:ribokinase